MRFITCLTANKVDGMTEHSLNCYKMLKVLVARCARR